MKFCSLIRGFFIIKKRRELKIPTNFNKYQCITSHNSYERRYWPEYKDGGFYKIYRKLLSDLMIEKKVQTGLDKIYSSVEYLQFMDKFNEILNEEDAKKRLELIKDLFTTHRKGILLKKVTKQKKELFYNYFDIFIMEYKDRLIYLNKVFSTLTENQGFKRRHNVWRFESIKFQLDDGKARGLEFDVHEDVIKKPIMTIREKYSSSKQENIKEFFVYHLWYNKRERITLREWFEAVKVWSDLNKNHEPIVIYLDLKHIISKKLNSKEKSFSNRLDDLIKRYFENRLYTPYEYMQNNQWPTLDDLKDKFIFVLSGGNTENISRIAPFKEEYDKNLKSLAFVDVSPNLINKYPTRVFINTYANIHKFTLSHEKIDQLISRHKVIRTWSTNELTTLFDVMDKGVNLLGTDRIDNLIRWHNYNPLVLKDNSGFQLRFDKSSVEGAYILIKRLYNIQKSQKNRINLYFIILLISILFILALIIFS